MSVTLRHPKPALVVETLALGVIEGGAKIEQLVVRPKVTIDDRRDSVGSSHAR